MEQEREQHVELQIRKHGLQRGPGAVGQADGAVLEAGVDPRFLNLAHQLLVEALIGFGLLFQRFVLERARVELIEFGLGIGHGALQHRFAVPRFLIFQVHALLDVRLQFAQLALEFRELRVSLLVFRVVGAVLHGDGGELFAGFVHAVGQSAKLLALGGSLGSFHGAALHGIVGGLFAHAVCLRVGEFGVELQ